jgi:hypothetical protein
MEPVYSWNLRYRRTKQALTEFLEQIDFLIITLAFIVLFGV